MKKIIVIGIVALVVSLAGGVGLGIMLRKAPEEQAPTNHAVVIDEQQTHGSGPFTRPPVPETPIEGDVAPATDQTQPEPDPVSVDQDSTDLQSTVVEPPADPPQAPTVIGPENEATENKGPETGNTEETQYRQFGKVLASMKASQAAEIIAYLSDEQAEGILRSLGVRQSAALLSAMPIERAAALSKRLLEHPTEEE